MDVVSVSSGVGSAFTWKLALDENPAAVGLFADVNGEHPDNYRFLAEVEEALGAPLVRIDNGGKTIWDVMCEGRFLANTRVDLCSRVLKREAIQGWLASNAPGSTVWLGFDWTEAHRYLGTQGHEVAADTAPPTRTLGTGRGRRWSSRHWTADTPTHGWRTWESRHRC